MIEQPTLFDAPETERSKYGDNWAGQAPRSEWREVPQARFLSWSRERQLSYCALRDEDSAAFDPDHAEFYRQRAQSYKETIDGKI